MTERPSESSGSQDREARHPHLRGVSVAERREVFARFGKRPSYAIGEVAIRYALRTLALLTVLVTALIITVLVWNAAVFFSFEDAGLFEFLAGTEWRPYATPAKWGMLPLLTGTLMVALGSAVIAIPLGLGSAVYLTQYAGKRVREFTTPILEILGGIPTIVYGYFAVTSVTPFLKTYLFDGVEAYNALSASIVVGIMILPMISSLSVDALRAVPLSIQHAGYALGMRRISVVTRIIVPAAFSGIVAAFILAFARAIGETMAVTLAAGLTPGLHLNYFESIQTMTAYIVQVKGGETPVGTIRYYSLYAIGLALFVFTFVFNYMAQRIVRRFREVYQ